MPLLHHLAGTLVTQEVVSTEEINMMLIDFDAKMSHFTILEEGNKEDLLSRIAIGFCHLIIWLSALT